MVSFATDDSREQFLSVQHPPLDPPLHDGHIVPLLPGQISVKFFPSSCLPTYFLLLQMFNKHVQQIEYFPIQNLHFKEGGINPMAQSHTCGVSYIGSIFFPEGHK